MHRVTLTLCLACVAALAWLPGPAGGAVDVKSGPYGGATQQQAVSPGFRSLRFTLTKKRRVRLTTEPVVAKGLCLSTPVFTLDGTPSTRVSGRGRFTFTRTFVGSRFHRISGRFISPTEVEGFVVYHFQDQDLCSGGKIRVRFAAKRS